MHSSGVRLSLFFQLIRFISDPPSKTIAPHTRAYRVLAHPPVERLHHLAAVLAPSCTLTTAQNGNTLHSIQPTRVSGHGLFLDNPEPYGETDPHGCLLSQQSTHSQCETRLCFVSLI